MTSPSIRGTMKSQPGRQGRSLSPAPRRPDNLRHSLAAAGVGLDLALVTQERTPQFEENPHAARRHQNRNWRHHRLYDEDRRAGKVGQHVGRADQQLHRTGAQGSWRAMGSDKPSEISDLKVIA
jgi:hypothetical protein